MIRSFFVPFRFQLLFSFASHLNCKVSSFKFLFGQFAICLDSISFNLIWNTLFQGLKRFVSRCETKCFTPRNKVFHTEKPTVSCRETKSFKGWNKKCPTTGAKVSNTETGRTKCGNALIKRINSGMFLELSDDICL